MSEPAQSSSPPIGTCGLLGLLFGMFVFPCLWILGLYVSSPYDASGARINNLSTLFATILIVPLSVIGGVVFAPLGALIGYIIGLRARHREARKP